MSDKTTQEVVSKSSFAFPKNRPTARPAPAMTVSLADEDEQSPAVEPAPARLEPAPREQSEPSLPVKPSPFNRPAPPNSNPDLLSVELPSSWVFYDFKALSLGNIRGKHQAKFAAAAKNESTRMVVETVSTLIGEGIDAATLTIPDFQFVLYQLRLNCMGANLPLKVKGVCSNPDHVLEVAEGKKTRETLSTVELVTRSTLKETQLDPQILLDFQVDHGSAIEELNNYGLDLDAPRMVDSISLEEEFADSPDYDAVEFLTDLAGSIKSTDGSPLSFKERLDKVSDLPPSLTMLLQEWQVVVQSYGVQEFIQMKCKECGADIEVSASIPAASFFRLA